MAKGKRKGGRHRPLISDEAAQQFLETRWPSKKYPTRIMLDSGAFSAWKRNLNLDAGLYAETVKELEGLIDSYINMDIIAGTFGGEKTDSMMEDAAERSLKGYKQLKKRKLDPMAVFHQGERWYWLHAYVDAGCKYIGIAPRKDIMFRERMAWMAKVFEHIDKRYGDSIKVHGLGLSSMAAAVSFPWHSYDSTTWAKASAYGRVMIPPMGEHGEYDYLQEPMYIMFSKIVTRVSRTAKEGMYSVLGPRVKELVDRYLKDMGFTVDEMYDYTFARRSLNTLYCQKISEASRAFGAKHNHGGERRFVLSTNTGIPVSAILRKDFHVYDRLLSYYDLVFMGRAKGRPIDEVRKWVIMYLERETNKQEYGRFFTRRHEMSKTPAPTPDYSLFERYL